MPIGVLFDGEVLLHGAIYSVLSMGTKAVCGLAHRRHFWTVALAMIARGDLGFLMLASASKLALIDARLEAACAWARLRCSRATSNRRTKCAA